MKILVLLAVMAFCIVSGFSLLASSATTPSVPEAKVARKRIVLSPDESLAMRMVNEERTERGLAPLELDPVLTQAARLHSVDMKKRDYFSHIEPPPTKYNPIDRYQHLLGQKPEGAVGENIAYCNQPRLGMLHKGLMDSPDHKANILDKEYTHIGIGIYELDDGRIWLTQMFCCKKTAGKGGEKI